MEDLDSTVRLLDSILDTRSKRHLVAGILLSFAALFAGLAITSITVKEEEDESEDR